jgi:hypothetical protein
LFNTLSIVSVVPKKSGALNLGGGTTAVTEFRHELLIRRRSTDRVRRSSGSGLFGSSLSRSSDCCLLNVGARGSSGTTFREKGRAMPGPCSSSGCDAGGFEFVSSFPNSLFQKVLCSVDGLLARGFSI